MTDTVKSTLLIQEASNDTHLTVRSSEGTYYNNHGNIMCIRYIYGSCKDGSRSTRVSRITRVFIFLYFFFHFNFYNIHVITLGVRPYVTSPKNGVN